MKKYASLGLLAVLTSILICSGCMKKIVINTQTNTVEGSTLTPEVSETPVISETPVLSETPVISQTPGISETPVITNTPETPIHIIEVIDGVTYIDGILVVNKTYSIPSTYGNGLTDEMNEALDRMFSAAKKEGITLYVASGYRSYSRQETIYNNYVRNDGKENADRYSARPGHSEHQTGLAADINKIEDDFGETKEGIWLANHCAEFGFIIRYPKGKENITGYIYEPWHIRFVGTELATKLSLGDGEFMTLEEYFGITSVYSDEG